MVGAGGVGKTALSAAFAGRFGWRWPGGVIGYSLAEQPVVSPETVFISLLTRLTGSDPGPELAGRPAEQLFEIFCSRPGRPSP